MKKPRSVRLTVILTTLAISVFASAVSAQAPGVRERSEARRDREGRGTVGSERKAEGNHQRRVEAATKAANEYKSSKKDAAAKQRYQDAKKKGDW